MISVHRLVATLGLSTALLVSSAGVAAAESWPCSDPQRDVLTITDDDTVVAAPDQVAGDVVATSISYTPRRVVIKIRMRAVPRESWGVFAVIRTPRTSFDLTYFKLGQLGFYDLTKSSSGDDVRCRAKSFRVQGNAVVLTVSRRCLGKPSAVRVGAGVAVYDGDLFTEEDEDVAVFADDALRRAIGEDLRLSPRIRRG